MKRFLGFLAVVFLAVAPAQAVTKYIRLDGNNACLGTTNACYGTGTCSDGTTASLTACAYKDFGYAMGDGVTKACGDEFVLVDTNPNGQTRFFSTKFSGSAPLTLWKNVVEFVGPEDENGNPDICPENNRIVLRSNTEDADDVLVTPFVPVTEIIEPFATDIQIDGDPVTPGMQDICNDLYTGDFPNVYKFCIAPGGIWPGALHQDGPDTNHTKYYLNGSDAYYGFFDNTNPEYCSVSSPITSDGLVAVNARHHTWLSGIPPADSLAGSPGLTAGVVYFHAQTNTPLVNGPDVYQTPASGNGGDPTLGQFQMYKQVRQQVFRSLEVSGLEIRNLSFDGQVQIGGNYLYVHGNKFRRGNVMLNDNGNRAGYGGLVSARYERNENEQATLSIFSAVRTTNAGHEQAGWRITDNILHRAFANVLRPEYIGGTDDSRGLIARNRLGPALTWYKRSGAIYQCATGTWLRPYSNDHILFIGSGAQPLQALHNADIVNNTLYGSQEGMGIFYSYNVSIDGNVFTAPEEDGTDVGHNGETFATVGQGIGFCGNNADTITVTNNVFWTGGLGEDGFSPGIFVLGQGSGACIAAVDSFPTANYNMYIHPEIDEAVNTILCDTRTDPDTCYTLEGAVNATYEGAGSDESWTTSSLAGMVDPTYTGRDYRLTAAAPQIDGGHPTTCGHGVCSGGSAPADTPCFFDDSPVTYPASDLARCPGGGTCVIDGTACDQGAYEFLEPTIIIDPPGGIGGGAGRPDIRRFGVKCSSDVCVGTIGTGTLPTTVHDDGDPYTAEMCYRTVTAGGIDDEAELALATCEPLVGTVLGSNQDNKIEVSGLDATEDYIWVARVYNTTYDTESDVDEDLADAVAASTGSVDAEIDCSDAAVVQGVIDDICDGSRDVDSTAGTEPLSCIPSSAVASWTAGISIPATCLHTATPVAITWTGNDLEIQASPTWWTADPTECPSSSCGDCDCDDDGYPDAAQEDESGLTAIDVRSDLHEIINFVFIGFKDGIRMDGRSATDGVAEITLNNITVKYPGDDCFSIEEGSGAQDGMAGHSWTDLTCENALDKGYQLYGIPTTTAAHTDEDLLGTRLTCKNCSTAFRFEGAGRWILSAPNVYETTGLGDVATCTNGIRQDAVASYLSVNGNGVFDGCRWGIRTQGGAHALIEDTSIKNSHVTGVYISGAATKIVVDGSTLAFNGGSSSSLVGYGGVSVAADATAANICLGVCSQSMDFTAADPTGTTKSGLGQNVFTDNRAPTLGLIDLYSLNASSVLADQNCFGSFDSNPSPQTFGTFDTDPILARCGGVGAGATGAFSPTGTVYLSRTVLGGPEVAGGPFTVTGGTSGDTFCGALTPARTCTGAVTSSTFAAATCASSTGTRTVLCEE